VPVDRFVNPAQWQKQLFLASNSHRTDAPSEIGPTAIYLSRPKGLGSLTR